MKSLKNLMQEKNLKKSGTVKEVICLKKINYILAFTDQKA